MRIKTALLALLLSSGLALAQAPPPVPGLPDAPRLTSVTLSGSTGPVSVGFQIYGDGSDYGNWIEVFVNNVYQTPVTNWTLSSPSGSLTNLPRPITNAQVTFVSPQTGTVVIVGARRPRRVAQFAENKGVPARDLNVALTDLVTQNRETWDKFNDISGRTLLGVPGDGAIALLPPAASRASGVLGFDATGKIPVMFSPGVGPPTPTLVTSVFGRIGNVTAQANDYDFPSIGPGKLALGQMPTIAANNLYGSFGGPAVAVPVPPCAAGSALGWTAGTGFFCTVIPPAPVLSFNTRVGAVVPAANDYSFPQISGSLAFGQMPTIPADNLVGNPTVATAVPGPVPLLNCAGGSSALNYSTATHTFTCNSIAATATPGPPSLAYQWNNAGILSGSPTLAHTAAGIDTESGTLNVTGTFQFGGVPQVFPSSGLLVGATDTQTLTGKTIDTAGNTLKIAGTTITGKSGTTGRVPFVNPTMVSGNCLTTDANGNIVDTGSACGSGGGGSGTVNNGTIGSIAFYGATGTAVSGNPNLTVSGGNALVGIPGTGSAGTGVAGTASYANDFGGTIKLQPPAGVPLGSTVLTWPVRAAPANIATTTGAFATNDCTKFDAAGNIVTTGAACAGATLANGPANAIQAQDATGSGVFTGTADATLSGPGGIISLGQAGVSNGILALSASAGGTTNLRNTNGGSGTIRLPPGTDTLVGLALAQTLTTKTIDTGSNTFQVAGTTITGKQGASGVLAMAAGSFTANNCVKSDASGNIVDNGAPCVTLPANNTLTIASGTAALGTASIASPSCAAAVTVAAAGVLTTDTLTVSFNGDPTGVTGYVPLTTGMLTIIPYPTAGNVNFKVCNNTASAITPGAITLNWRVVR